MDKRNERYRHHIQAGALRRHLRTQRHRLRVRLLDIRRIQVIPAGKDATGRAAQQVEPDCNPADEASDE